MKTALQIGLTALLVGALAFYGGVMYGRASGGGRGGMMVRFGGGQGGPAGFGGGQGGANAARFRGGFAGGDVISADAKSITVKMADGSTKTIYFDGNTRIVRSAEATTSDLAQGITVVVVGTAGNDGSVTARSIQIVPKGANVNAFGGGMMRGFGFGGGGGRQGQGGNGGGNGGAPSGGPGFDEVPAPPPGQ